MPTFKHPCPHCGKYIERDVAACPSCGRLDPFAPGRCPACNAPIADPSWVACGKCGTPLGAAAAVAAPAAAPAPAALASSAQPRACTGCGSPLPAGARFCKECGTVAA
jgi:Meckel syndrome type 1 protein